MKVRLLWISPEQGSLDRVDALLAERRRVPGLAFLLRRPDARAALIVDEARRLMRHGVPLLLSRADLALATEASGVHLPERGLDPSELRRLRPDWLIGVSRHDATGLNACAGADYATLSPFGAVEGKNRALGEEGFRRASAQASTRILALGGIDASSAPRALAAGASGLAFIRAGLSRSEFDGLVKVLDSPTPLG